MVSYVWIMILWCEQVYNFARHKYQLIIFSILQIAFKMPRTLPKYSAAVDVSYQAHFSKFPNVW